MVPLHFRRECYRIIQSCPRSEVYRFKYSETAAMSHILADDRAVSSTIHFWLLLPIIPISCYVKGNWTGLRTVITLESFRLQSFYFLDCVALNEISKCGDRKKWIFGPCIRLIIRLVPIDDMPCEYKIKFRHKL